MTIRILVLAKDGRASVDGACIQAFGIRHEKFVQERLERERRMAEELMRMMPEYDPMDEAAVRARIVHQMSKDGDGRQVW
jgi:hypothetical protein